MKKSLKGRRSWIEYASITTLLTSLNNNSNQLQNQVKITKEKVHFYRNWATLIKIMDLLIIWSERKANIRHHLFLSIRKREAMHHNLTLGEKRATRIPEALTPNTIRSQWWIRVLGMSALIVYTRVNESLTATASLTLISSILRQGNNRLIVYTFSDLILTA